MGTEVGTITGTTPGPVELEGMEQAHLCHQAFSDALGAVTSTNPDHAYSKSGLVPWQNSQKNKAGTSLPPSAKL